MGKKINRNPAGIKLGDKVRVKPNGIVTENTGKLWEVISIHEGTGSCTLHMVGESEDRTAGGFLDALIPEA